MDPRLSKKLAWTRVSAGRRCRNTGGVGVRAVGSATQNSERESWSFCVRRLAGVWRQTRGSRVGRIT